MKQVKLIAILSILFILFTIFSTNSYAVEGDTFELQLSSSASTLNPGDDFTVNIVLDNINVTGGEQGIGAYQATLTYDSNILELVSVTAASGWEVSENEGNIVANTSNAQVVKQRTNTAVINFKVKANATTGNTTISIGSIRGSSTETISGTGVATTISIRNEINNPTDGNNETGDNNTTGGNNEAGNTNIAGGNNSIGNNAIRNNTSISSNVNTSTTANKSLPKAGFTNMIIIAIVIMMISAIVFFVKCKVLKLK